MGASKTPTIRRVVVYSTALVLLVLASPVPELYWVGFSLALAGELLRIWACGHLRKNQAVIQSGPYAHVKNPLYLGTFLILVGLLVAASNPYDVGRYFLVLGMPFVLGIFFAYYLPYKFSVEGNRLRRRFGETWDQYNKSVPDFIPRLTPFQQSDVKWNSKLVVQNSEIGAAMWVLAAFAVIGLRMAVDIPGLY